MGARAVAASCRIDRRGGGKSPRLRSARFDRQAAGECTGCAAAASSARMARPIRSSARSARRDCSRQASRPLRAPVPRPIAISPASTSCPAGSAIERVTALATRGYLTNQLLRDIDAVSMAHSLEVRVPYLDPVVVDTALSLPDSAKLGDVRDADPVRPDVSRVRSEARAHRRRASVATAGLRRAAETRLRHAVRGVASRSVADVLDDTLDARAARRRGLLEVAGVDRGARPVPTGETSWAEPWLLMMLELWCREVLDT